MSDDYGQARVWSPHGVAVTLPLAGSGPGDYAGMLADLGRALAAGWLASPPGVQPGEHRDEIGFVVRREKLNDDGSVTPVVDLYPADEGMKFALLAAYLNTDDHVAAFERAAGVKLTNLPVYVGDNKIERGKKPATDRLVVKVPRPFGAVWKDNPKYDPAEQDTKKKKPKRLFVRWADHPAAAPRQQPAEPARPEDPVAALVADIGAAEHLPQLRCVWEDGVVPRWGEFDAAQIRTLTAAKTRRKAELEALAARPGPATGGGRVFDNAPAAATNLPG